MAALVGDSFEAFDFDFGFDFIVDFWFWGFFFVYLNPNIPTMSLPSWGGGESFG